MEQRLAIELKYTLTLPATFSTNLFCTFLAEIIIQGGSNMTGTDLYVNKPHCAAAVRP